MGTILILILVVLTIWTRKTPLAPYLCFSVFSATAGYITARVLEWDEDRTAWVFATPGMLATLVVIAIYYRTINRD